MLDINVTVTEEDYLTYNEYVVFHSPANRGALRARRFLVPVILLLGAVFAFFWFDTVVAWIQTGVFLIFGILWFVLSPTLLKKSIRRNVKRMKQSGKLPYHETALLRFSDDGVTVVTDNSTTVYHLADIEKVCGTESICYLFVGCQTAILIPLRCVDAEEKRNAFFTWINENLKEKCTDQ